MEMNRRSTMRVGKVLPPHSYHPNASLMMFGKRSCYVAMPFRNRANEEKKA